MSGHGSCLIVTTQREDTGSFQSLSLHLVPSDSYSLPEFREPMRSLTLFLSTQTSGVRI